jgi:hypothetical protein
MIVMVSWAFEWKEAVIISLKVLSQRYPGETEENHDNHQHNR